MCIWQCSCTLQTWGFSRPAVNFPWLAAAFPLSFFCLIHLLIFPVWQAIIWQALPRSGQQEENTAASSTCPAKLRKTHLPGSEMWGKGQCNRGMCSPFSNTCELWTSCKFFCPVKNQEKHYQKHFSPQCVSVRPITNPLPMMTLKCISPVYCVHFVYYGWWSTA